MQFWFCEKCGTRVTATELAKGAVRDDETGMVHCVKCAPAAVPVPVPVAAPAKGATPAAGNAPPAQATTARMLPARGASARVRETTILRRRETSSGRPLPERQNPGSGERAAVPAMKKNMPLLMGIGGAVVLLVLIGIFMSLGSTPAEKKVADSDTRNAPEKTDKTDKAERKETDKPVEKDPPSPPTKVERAADTAATSPVLTQREAVKEEAAAQDAFTALESKLKTLSDVESQKNAIDAFLAKYDNFIVGARARNLKSKLKDGPLQFKPPAIAQTPTPAAPAAPAQAAPEDPNAVVANAQAFAAKQDYAGAIAVYDKAIAANGNTYQYYQNRANMKLLAGDFDGVAADCDKAIAVQADWGAYAMKAIVAFAKKKDDDYRACIEKAASLKNITAKAMEASLANDLQRGRWIFEGKPFDTKAPDKGVEFWARGHFRLVYGKVAEGIADLREALKRDATLGPKGLFAELADLARAQKDFKEAQNVLKQWAESKPETPQGLNAYAFELLNCADTTLRDPKTGLAMAEKAAELSQKKDAGILDTLAIAYFFNNRISTAISTEEKALALLPPEIAPEIKQQLEKHLADFKAMEGKATY